MDGWSSAVASDHDRSSSEGEYVVEHGPEAETGEDVEQRGDMESRMDDVGTAAVGFGISGIGEGKVVLGRVGQRDDKELRYLHLLWEPGRVEPGRAELSSACKLRKMAGSRARRYHRAVRNLGPIGKDIYGKGHLRCLFVN